MDDWQRQHSRKLSHDVLHPIGANRNIQKRMPGDSLFSRVMNGSSSRVCKFNAPLRDGNFSAADEKEIFRRELFPLFRSETARLRASKSH